MSSSQPWADIRERTSKPSMSGITMSSSTMEISEPQAFRSSRHLGPLGASRISKSSQRISERMSRFMGESSTMSTIGRWSFSERTASGAMSSVTTVFLLCFARYIRLSAMGRASLMGMPAAITPPMLAETCIFSNSGRWAAKRRLLMSLSLRTKASAEMSGRMSSSSSPPYRTSISVERMQRWMMETMSRSAASPAE